MEIDYYWLVNAVASDYPAEGQLGRAKIVDLFLDHGRHRSSQDLPLLRPWNLYLYYLT